MSDTKASSERINASSGYNLGSKGNPGVVFPFKMVIHLAALAPLATLVDQALLLTFAQGHRLRRTGPHPHLQTVTHERM